MFHASREEIHPVELGSRINHGTMTTSICIAPGYDDEHSKARTIRRGQTDMNGDYHRTRAIQQHAINNTSASPLAFIAAHTSKHRAQTRKPPPPPWKCPRALPAVEPFIAPRCLRSCPISQPP